MLAGSQPNQELRNHPGTSSLVHDHAVGRSQTSQWAETQLTSPQRIELKIEVKSLKMETAQERDRNLHCLTDGSQKKIPTWEFWLHKSKLS